LKWTALRQILHPVKTLLSLLYGKGKEAPLKSHTEEPRLSTRIQPYPSQNDAIIQESSSHLPARDEQDSLHSSNDRSSLIHLPARDEQDSLHSSNDRSSVTSSLDGGQGDGYPRTDSTYSCDADESDPQVTSARYQLSSIPDPDEPLKLGLEEERGESRQPPVQLSEILQFVLPQSVFDYLPIKDVLPLAKVNRHMKELVDTYFLHYVLPQTEIYYYLDHIMEDGSPPSEEYQRLYPVIRRIDKASRGFPGDRVVFEPEFESTPKYTYRKNTFNHVEIKFHLGDWRRPKTMLLDGYHRPAADTPYSYRADGGRKSHKLPYTRMYHYIRFDTFESSPIYVFYKDVSRADGVVALHAISIPLNFLRQSLSSTTSDNKPEPVEQRISSYHPVL
jgi:hypothetical protein